jgi:arylsulfatase A-like enzyme
LPTLALSLFVTLSVYSLIRSLRLGVAPIAAVALALGVATVVKRLLDKRPHVVRRRMIGAVPWMVGALLLYAIAIPIVRRTTERRALAALPPGPKAPNVLIVVWDAARHLDLSLYGYERQTTPNLDKFAAGGVVFERAFSTAPWTLPSHASMLTGRYPHEMTAGHRQPLDASFPMLSEALSARGYATGGFVGNLFFLQTDFGLARGFTTYDARPPFTLASVLSTWFLAKTTYEAIAAWRGDHGELVRRRASHVNDDLTAWIARRGDRPFFAFVNYFDAHEPYLPPAPFDTLFSSRSARYWHAELPRPYTPEELRQLRDTYDAGIRYMDFELQRLLDRLKEMGELDRTVVVVTADHGEEFGEHDPSLVAHSLTVHTTSTLVPMVVWYPPRLAGGLRLTAPVSLRDIPATVMDLTGAPDGHAFPGVSLARYAGDSAVREAPTPRVAVVERKKTGELPPWTANNGNMYSVIDSTHQYIVDAQKKEHLFNLTDDLWERNDLAGDPANEGRLRRMRFLLDSLIAGADGTLRARAPATNRGFGGGKFIRRR